MPNEPDNDKQKPIHQWLEAYARRRREQAGEPIPLHPATRRLWHSEISRQYPGAIPGSSAGAFLNWLRFRWPRLVIGLGAAALLAVSVTAVLWQTPRPTGALPRAERSAATANDQPVPGDALAHLSPQPKAVTMTPADEQRSDKLSPAATAPARPAGLASAEPREKAAASPAGRTGRFNEPADARSARAPSSPAATPPRPIASPELAGPKPTQAPLPSAPGREVVPALIVAQADDASRRPVTAVADAGQAANPSLNRFLALAPVKGERPAENAEVLAQFDFEQVGDTVRLIDADGSVYPGQWIGLEETKDAGAREEAERYRQRVQLEQTATKRLTSTAGALQKSPQGAAEGWSFRVAGTNRTLQQPVEFEGVLVQAASYIQAVPAPIQRQNLKKLSSSQLPVALNSQTSATPPAARFYRAGNTPSAGAAAGQAQNQAAYNNTTPPGLPAPARSNVPAQQRIQGTLRIGLTNQVLIDAYRP